MDFDFEGNLYYIIGVAVLLVFLVVLLFKKFYSVFNSDGPVSSGGRVI